MLLKRFCMFGIFFSTASLSVHVQPWVRHRETQIYWPLLLLLCNFNDFRNWKKPLFFRHLEGSKEDNVKAASKRTYKALFIFVVIYYTSFKLVLNLVVVVEQAQSVGAVLVPVDAHHGLGGGCQRVLQVRPPCLVLAGVGPPHSRERVLVGDHHHQTLTERCKHVRESVWIKKINKGLRLNNLLERSLLISLWQLLH